MHDLVSVLSGASDPELNDAHLWLVKGLIRASSRQTPAGAAADQLAALSQGPNPRANRMAHRAANRFFARDHRRHAKNPQQAPERIP